MTPQIISCPSRIERVVVYARGAVVTRRIEVPPELPAEACEIAIPGVTPRAEVGSLRALVEGDQAGREIVGVRARLVVPRPPVQPASLASRLRDVELTLARLSAERTHLQWRRDLLGAVWLDPELMRRFRPPDPAERINDALAVSALLSAEIEALDGRVAALDREIERSTRELAEVRLAASQATTAEVQGEAPPSFEVLIRLAPSADTRGGAALAGPSMTLEYAVLAARWWPAYTARFSHGATRVALSLDAFVAQASGEDWKDALLALSTADLVQDATLPELTSLRLGRAQPARRRGYRAPPEGLAAMFEGYDRFVASLPPAPPAGGARTYASLPRAPSMAAPPPPPPMMAAPMPPPASAAPPARLMSASTLVDEDEDQPTSVGLAQMAASLPFQQAPAGRAAPPPLPGRPAAARPGAAPPPPPSYGAASPLAAALDAPPAGGGAPPVADLAIEPAEAWLDFDALRLAAADDRARRGRLARRDAGPGARAAAQARAEIDRLSDPAGAVDPRSSRGQFDHLYTAAGTALVPSSGRPHRVAVMGAEGSAAPRFVTVPREAPEVYREVEIRNPFGAPLLAGPIEIFIDGALSAQSSISHIDRGGTIRAGLGVEDRLRVARNARVEESSAGLLGGSLAVEHEVTIDLSSSLGRSISIEVIDRIPVTDEKDLDIKLLSSQPKAQPYTQVEVGDPVRKGLRWTIDVPAGGKASVAFTYRITLSAKNEIVGGNRRE